MHPHATALVQGGVSHAIGIVRYPGGGWVTPTAGSTIRPLSHLPFKEGVDPKYRNLEGWVGHPKDPDSALSQWRVRRPLSLVPFKFASVTTQTVALNPAPKVKSVRLCPNATFASKS